MLAVPMVSHLIRLSPLDTFWHTAGIFYFCHPSETLYMYYVRYVFWGEGCLGILPIGICLVVYCYLFIYLIEIPVITKTYINHVAHKHSITTR